MATTNPTIIQNDSTGVTVQGVNGFTYEQFLNSLGSNVFRVLEMYLTASSLPQLNQAISYNISDASGKDASEVITLDIDPYQKVSAFSKDLRDRNIILNGQSSLSFNILAGESLMIQLRSEQYNVSDGLNVLSEPNKDMLDGKDEYAYAGGVYGVGTGVEEGFEQAKKKYVNYFWIVVACAVAASLINYNKDNKLIGK
jgi:hypothetical protein